MGSMSIWHWIVVLIYLGLLYLLISSMIRILRRTGHSGWWVLLTFVPIVNILAVWRFSKARWMKVDA